MSIELFFTSLFAGYWFRWMLHSTHYVSLRAAGYHVLFKSIVAGGVLLVIARGLLWIFDGMNLEPLMGDAIIERIFQAFSAESPHYLNMLVLIGVLAILLPWLMNLAPWVRQWWKEEKQVQRVIVRLEHPSRPKRFLYKIWHYFFCTKESAVWMDATFRGDATEMAFLRSLHNQDMIELVMQDRSYIGFVTERELAEPGNMPEIGLVPVARTYLSSSGTEKLYTYFYKQDLKKHMDELELGRSESKPGKNMSNRKSDELDWSEKVAIFRLSSIRFIRRIPCDDIGNYMVKMLEEMPPVSRRYVWASNLPSSPPIGKRD